MRRLIVPVLLLSGCPRAPAGPEPPDDVRLRVEVVDATQGGPVVLDVLLTNNGRERLIPGRAGGLPDGGVRVAAATLPARFVWDEDGTYCGADGSTPLRPGETRRERVYVHQRFHLGESVRVPVEVQWVFRRVRSDEVPVATGPTERSHRLVLTLAPATPARLLEVRRGVERALAADVPEDDFEKEVNRILFTKQEAFIPLAFRLLEQSRAVPHFRLVDLILDSSGTPDQGARLIVDYCLAHRTRAVLHFFAYWGARSADVHCRLEEIAQAIPSLPVLAHTWHLPLAPQAGRLVWRFAELLFAFRKLPPSSEVSRLSRSSGPWLRALCHATFPRQLGHLWTASFRSELAAYHQPVEPIVFRHLLQRLDDPRFRTREAAVKELVQLNDRVLPFLKSSPSNVSAEVTRLIDRIRSDIERAGPDPVDSMMVDYLHSLNTPAARNVLAAFAKGSPEGWVAREAASRLRRMGDSGRAAP